MVAGCKHPRHIMERGLKVYGNTLHPIHLNVSSNEPMNEILQYLKKHGEKLDMEIAIATGISLTNVRLHLSELATKGEIMTCHLIRHEKGKTVEGISCRIAGYIPPAAPGRKSKAQLMGADKG